MNDASDGPTARSAQPPRTAKRTLGPGLLVAAAFIGPGTVTTVTVAGADHGFDLLWVLVFGLLTAVLLQEMSARLGIVSREGLGEALRTTFDNPAVSYAAIVLVIVAIGVGNAAFEAGNIIGAALGMEALTGVGTRPWAVMFGIAALAVLASSVYRTIERALVVLVVLMSLCFLGTVVLVRPDLGDLLGGFVPGLPSGSTLTVVALIGTTVVPYNLFLHASSVQEKWAEDLPTDEALSAARNDTVLSIGLGGLITLAVLSTAAAAFFATGTTVEDAGMMAEQLEPLLGRTSQVVFATGLLAAGLTSSITAPLAAAFAIAGGSPVEAIVFAQAANGLVLPLIAIFLLVVMNRRDLLGEHRNGPGGNIAGAIVVLIVSGLGIYNLVTAFTDT